MNTEMDYDEMYKEAYIQGDTEKMGIAWCQIYHAQPCNCCAKGEA